MAGKLTRTAGPSVQRPEQSDAKVTSTTELGGSTGKSSTVSGWAGSSVFLDLVALNLPPLEAGLFSTFRAARFGATAVACPLPLASPWTVTVSDLVLKILQSQITRVS